MTQTESKKFWDISFGFSQGPNQTSSSCWTHQKGMSDYRLPVSLFRPSMLHKLRFVQTWGDVTGCRAPSSRAAGTGRDESSAFPGRLATESRGGMCSSDVLEELPNWLSSCMIKLINELKKLHRSLWWFSAKFWQRTGDGWEAHHQVAVRAVRAWESDVEGKLHQVENGGF